MDTVYWAGPPIKVPVTDKIGRDDQPVPKLPKNIAEVPCGNDAFRRRTAAFLKWHGLTGTDLVQMFNVVPEMAFKLDTGRHTVTGYCGDKVQEFKSRNYEFSALACDWAFHIQRETGILFSIGREQVIITRGIVSPCRAIVTSKVAGVSLPVLAVKEMLEVRFGGEMRIHID